MALKDWKKTQDEPLVYVKKTNGDRWLGIRQVDNMWHTILPNGKRNKFQSESEAFKHIQDYMGSH